MKCILRPVIFSIILLASGCAQRDFDDSTYVLMRNSTLDGSTSAFGAYFIYEDARMNGINCREVMGLANEAIDARLARGEGMLVKYECISLAEARDRGLDPKTSNK